MSILSNYQNDIDEIYEKVIGLFKKASEEQPLYVDRNYLEDLFDTLSNETVRDCLEDCNCVFYQQNINDFYQKPMWRKTEAVIHIIEKILTKIREDSSTPLVAKLNWKMVCVSLLRKVMMSY